MIGVIFAIIAVVCAIQGWTIALWVFLALSIFVGFMEASP